MSVLSLLPTHINYAKIRVDIEKGAQVNHVGSIDEVLKWIKTAIDKEGIAMPTSVTYLENTQPLALSIKTPMSPTDTPSIEKP